MGSINRSLNRSSTFFFGITPLHEELLSEIFQKYCPRTVIYTVLTTINLCVIVGSDSRVVFSVHQIRSAFKHKKENVCDRASKTVKPRH